MILLEHGANLNAADYSGDSALHVASRSGKIPVVELLLEYGVNVDFRDKEGQTPLHKAAYYLKLQVLVVLLDCGADPLAQTHSGKTPFQLANAPYNWVPKGDQLQIKQLLCKRTGERIWGLR